MTQLITLLGIYPNDEYFHVTFCPGSRGTHNLFLISVQVNV